MSQQTYERLVEALGKRGGAAPAIKCPELYELLNELFTPEEASLASEMPMQPISAADLATETGRDPAEVEQLLDVMANKGLIISRDRRGVDLFTIQQMMPGIFEYQFMRGEVNDRCKRLAHLFDDFLDVVAKSLSEGTTPPLFPFARVIPVEEEVTASVQIETYDRVSHYIDTAEHVSVSTCYCRHHGDLLDQGCGKPKEVCLTFGPAAKFNDKRGFGRLISKEEARRILDLSEKEGLVHCSTNTGRYVDFICNCCSCHCFILRSIKHSGMPSAAATSGFIAMVSDEDCIGCEECVERCQMEALSMNGDVVERDAGRCIGCGICVSACTSGAISMEPREDRPVTPYDRKSLNDAMLASVGMRSNTG